MTQAEHIQAAKDFAGFWVNKGDEKQESQRFWIQLLGNVLGIPDPASYIEFEKPVKLTHTSYIDAYIAGTKVLVEQKGADIDLHKAYKQSDGAVLSPYQQAKRYVGEMKASEKPRWIVVCNFTEFLIYDLEVPNGEPRQQLADLYDETFMPADLRAALRENDKAVMAAYGFGMKMTESECVAELFKLYEKLSASS